MIILKGAGKESNLIGRKASNLIGALGEIIAWDALRKVGIWTYKIGSWGFFPRGYPYWTGELDEEHRFLSKEQAAFVENKVRNGIIEYDFVAVRWKRNSAELAGEVGEVYLIEVKTGRPKAVSRYLRDSSQAFTLASLEKAKRVGFKVILVIVELLDNWKYRITCRSRCGGPGGTRTKMDLGSGRYS